MITIDEAKNLFANSFGSLSFLIANKGIAGAKYLTVDLETELPHQPDKVYVGNIEPDDYETVDFGLDLRDVPPGLYRLKLNVEYKDAYNKDVVESREFEIEVKRQEVSLPSTNTLLVIILFLVALVWWKRKKLLK